jgi:GTP cyclohydrolase II
MNSLERQEKSFIPTKYGKFDMYAYASKEQEKMPHLVLCAKGLNPSESVYLRIHSECITGDLFSSQRCDCGEQLDESLKIIKENKGLLIYLRQEGRGIGIINKMKAYNHQDEGLDANTKLGFRPDERKYDDAITILKDLSIYKIKLITNNPEKINSFVNSGIEVEERIPLVIEANAVNRSYLDTKEKLMGHLMHK